MHTVSYSRRRLPAEDIQHAVWLYFQFPLSFRDVEDLSVCASRGCPRLTASVGADAGYKAVRRAFPFRGPRL
jgi:transposase-like protein